MTKKHCAPSLIIAIAIGAVIQGCGSTYGPILLEHPNGQVLYVCDTERRGGNYHATIVEHKGDKQRFLSLDGKPASMVVSRDGKTLAVALSSNNKIEHRLVLIETTDLQVRGQWPIPVATAEHVVDTDRVPEIQRIRRMALSDNSRLLAASCSIITPQTYESVVMLLDAESGNLVQKLHLPKPSELLLSGHYGQAVTSMAFSGDDTLLALSAACFWKDLNARQPDGFIRVWNIGNGKHVTTFRPEGDSWRFLRGLCFNSTGSHLAGWSWAEQDTKRSRVGVWSLLTGKKTAEMIIEGKVRQISRVDGKGAFHIWTAQGKRLVLNE